jgi:hypothetical protein
MKIEARGRVKIYLLLLLFLLLAFLFFLGILSKENIIF